jgi:hypothetical protein
MARFYSKHGIEVDCVIFYGSHSADEGDGFFNVIRILTERGIAIKTHENPMLQIVKILHEI